MGKFRDLFKVRQPGHGDAWQNEKNENEQSEGISIENKGTKVPNGGEKTSV